MTHAATTPVHAPAPVSTDPLPTFIGIGTQRAGTTWLYECLNQHPKVFMSADKELGYFGAERGRGLDWYRRQFADRGEALAFGEITPTYIVDRQAILQMAETVPDAKLFLVLREPVSRAYSAYQLFREKRFAGKSFAEAAQPDSDLIRYGQYAAQLKTLFEHFPTEQVKVFLYDDITARPDWVLAELFEFIGVDSTFRPAALTQRYNRVILPRTQAMLGKLGLGELVESIKATPIGPWIKRVHARMGKKPDQTLSPEDRQRIAAYFADDLTRVEQMIGRDLSAWR
jgi:hypothetical protein